MNLKEIETKWQETWKKEALFEPSVSDKEPFYIQVAYPYPSGAMHIGHARTYTVTDIVAKYHLLKGENVLMPMGWHVSGTPVVASVDAIKAGDKETIEKFTDVFHIPKKDLKELESPESYVDYMVNKAEYGYKVGFNKLGLGIDWRRELKTIDPQYKRFIEWQYKKLYAKGYVKKGKYPVRYCPKDENAVGDHDLLEGEGVGIQEFTILKFKMDSGSFIVAATLRPETVYGQTNLWLGSEVEYVKMKVDGEEWIGSNEFFEKLNEQRGGIKKTGSVKGKELIGKEVEAPGIKRKIPILPSFFCDTRTGTGIVTSVPSDAPIDYMGLVDLQKDDDLIKEFGLDAEIVKAIKVIPIIKTEEFGDMAAVQIVKDLKIENQFDPKLEEAKKRVYKLGFHKGQMNENCEKYAGMKVSEAKDLVKRELIEANLADRFWELEDKIVCRCGTEGTVKVLDDQWFVTYSDPDWKKESRETLKEMNIAPELFRTQYENVFGWLDDKPCTRSKGLGTQFPWQDDKIIEPLGDSTVYMAYFTISNLIKEIEAEKLDEEVFDFVFLGEGSAEKLAKEKGIAKEKLEEMKKEFDYWYPLAFNTSALELIPNHMSFSIFQHTAIFPKEKRQLGTLNLGMLVMEGKKMSSSKGNVILINDMVDRIGADYVRFFLMNSVEPWEEMDWRQREIDKGLEKLRFLVEQMKEKGKKAKDAGKITADLDQADKWMLNAFRKRTNTVLDAMESTTLRAALQELSFKLAKDLQWYKKRRKTENKALDLYIINGWTKLMAPFMPHISEEIWRGSLGNKESVFLSGLPEKSEVDNSIDLAERLVESVVSDVQNIKKITGKDKPGGVKLFVAAGWKWAALDAIRGIDRPDFNLALKEAMKSDEVKKQGKQAVQTIKRLAGKIMELKEAERIDELTTLKEAAGFIEGEIGCKIEVLEEAGAEQQFKAKASSALPFKPAIFLE